MCYHKFLISLTHKQLACINGHEHTVELLLRYKANKNKLNLLKEKPVECIGKFPHAKNIKSLLL